MNQGNRSADREVVQKVVAYVVRDGHLLVFVHDDFPMEVIGVQVPAGSVEPGEQPRDAVVREVFEETGLRTQVLRSLGEEIYDMAPSKSEVHERHFFELEVIEADSEDVPERWTAGEADPSDGGPAVTWTCWWIPLKDAHVLCAGFGARLGALLEEVPDRGPRSKAEVVLQGRLISADSGQAAVVTEHLPRHIELTRAEPGCIDFFVVRTDDPLVWQVDERFVDQNAYEKHQRRVADSEWGRATAGIERDYTVSAGE